MTYPVAVMNYSLFSPYRELWRKWPFAVSYIFFASSFSSGGHCDIKLEPPPTPRNNITPFFLLCRKWNMIFKILCQLYDVISQFNTNKSHAWLCNVQNYLEPIGLTYFLWCTVVRNEACVEGWHESGGVGSTLYRTTLNLHTRNLRKFSSQHAIKCNLATSIVSQSFQCTGQLRILAWLAPTITLENVISEH